MISSDFLTGNRSLTQRPNHCPRVHRPQKRDHLPHGSGECLVVINHAQCAWLATQSASLPLIKSTIPTCFLQSSPRHVPCRNFDFSVSKFSSQHISMTTAMSVLKFRAKALQSANSLRPFPKDLAGSVAMAKMGQGSSPSKRSSKVLKVLCDQNGVIKMNKTYQNKKNVTAFSILNLARTLSSLTLSKGCSRGLTSLNRWLKQTAWAIVELQRATVFKSSRQPNFLWSSN